MEKYNIGDVWWIHFPYEDEDKEKRRPAIVIDDDTIAILAMYVTSQNKENPYSIKLEDWAETGLSKPSWTRIDKIISINEWYMDRKIGSLSPRDLTKIMQLAAELLNNEFHEFSLIAVKNPMGKYLQKYDYRWNCWLFPYIKTAENNKENVDEYISELFHLSIDTSYIAQAKHCKYSESDNVYKIYNHKRYGVLLTHTPEIMLQDEFYMEDVKYRWMSIKELEQDENVMKKNADVIAFIKSKYL